MLRYSTISLIETDSRDRAAHSNKLSGSRFHVEPYESVLEFSQDGKTDTLILIRDADSAISDVLSDMRDRDYWAPAVAYGHAPEPIRCSHVMLQGFVGYLPMPFARHDLETLLDGAAEHLTALIELRRGAADARNKLRTLTTREAEVLDCLQAGRTNREIADTLDISPRTVEIHRANMLRKMDTKSALTAIRMSIHAKISP